MNRSPKRRNLKLEIQQRTFSGGSTLGRGGGAQAPKSWLGPKFSRTLDTL